MEIKDRLIRIITSEGLTSAAFADSIGVQRSSISHIISGRNKPSLDFLEKILISFPKYNAEWLIIGKGDIYKPPIQPKLFTDDFVPTKPLEKGIEELVNIPKANIKPITEDNLSISVPKEPEIGNPKTVIENFDQDSIINKAAKTKAVKKIVIFYEDNTFGIYLPE